MALAPNDTGTLFICATPIGNMEDITLRALRILKESDIIAAEDTRHTVKLLNHYEISTPMTSYHEHNKNSKGSELIKQLIDGKNIALVTDAGMPCISDPGLELVRLAHENKLPVTVVPGCTAFVSALALSGMDTGGFLFDGFLPRSNKECNEKILSYADETRTIALYEAPHRLVKTMSMLYEALGDRQAACVRELTKRHEELIEGSLSSLIMHFTANEPRGEFVLLLRGMDKQSLVCDRAELWRDMPLPQHMELYINRGMSEKDAMKHVAKDRGVTKKEIYSQLKIRTTDSQ